MSISVFQITAWSKTTHDLLHRLWLEGECPGIGLVSGYDHPEHALHNTVPFYHDDAPTASQAPVSENQPQTAPSADNAEQSQRTPQSQTAPQPEMALWSEITRETPSEGRLSQQVTFYAEPSKFLPFLMARFRALGGQVAIVTVTSLDQLAEYDVIINCTGLGAQSLFGDDTLCPIRGQLVRVRAPFVNTFLASGEFYIVPNDDVTILGGTRQVGDWRREPDPSDTARIINGCCHLVTALRTAPVVDVWAGLRPFRPAGVRLELERHLVAGRWRPVVHNYGHGGAGVTLFWGCALEVAALVRQQLQTFRADSKL